MVRLLLRSLLGNWQWWKLFSHRCTFTQHHIRIHSINSEDWLTVIIICFSFSLAHSFCCLSGPENNELVVWFLPLMEMERREYSFGFFSRLLTPQHVLCLRFHIYPSSSSRINNDLCEGWSVVGWELRREFCEGLGKGVWLVNYQEALSLAFPVGQFTFILSSLR